MAIPGLLNPIKRKIQTLRYPQLFALAAVLFLITLIVPDPIPFVDEVLLLIVTIGLGRLKRPRSRSTVPTTDDRRK